MNVRPVMLALALACMPQAAGAACSVTANPVSFGVYDPAAAVPLDAVGNVQVSCSAVALTTYNYTILLSPGNGSYAVRQMFSGGNALGYNLYTDAAHTMVWGDGSGGTSTVSGSISILLLGTVTNNHAVYGRMPAQQNVPAGSYADNITVTVNY